MAIKTYDELMQELHTVFKNLNDDNALSVLEDVTDTVRDGIDARTRFAENDNAWRKRYQERFFSGPAEGENPSSQNGADPILNHTPESEETEPENPIAEIHIDDLFKDDPN